MATYTKFQPFVEALSEKVHNLGSDQLVVALCAAASAPVNTNGQLSQLTTINHANLSTRNITTTSSSQTSGVYKLVLTDLVLTASGAVPTFRYIVIYNDTATNDELIAFFDYGSDVTLNTAGETFTLDFDGTNGFEQTT
jgi:hypothetical protein